MEFGTFLYNYEHCYACVQKIRSTCTIFNVINRLFSDCYHANIINSKKEMSEEIIPRFFRKCRALIIVEVYSQANL